MTLLSSAQTCSSSTDNRSFSASAALHVIIINSLSTVMEDNTQKLLQSPMLSQLTKLDMATNKLSVSDSLK